MLIKHLPILDVEKTAKSGQCFRFTELNKNKYKLVAFNRRIDVNILENGNIGLSCTEDDFQNIWLKYFDLDTDYAPYHNVGDDYFLLSAIDKGYGIRMLRQDKFEALISFIISQRKNIPAIQASIEKLCQKFGFLLDDNESYSFPTPNALANATLDDLYACSLGYRAPYILETSRLVAQNPSLLQSFDSLNDNELILKLMEFKGVGIKVASCVALFAYHRLGIFPRDVWIIRMEDNYYNGHFPDENYPDCAGLLQQYCFYAMRDKK